MRNVLLSSMPILLWVMTLVNLLFFVLLLRMDKRGGDRQPLLMAGVSFGLFYDALILALGTVVPAGGLLKTLSLFRFVFHCGLIPLLFPICAKAMGVDGKALKVVWAVTALIMAAGVIAGFVTALAPAQVGGVVRYASDKTLTPGWSAGIQNALSYGPIIILMVCGVIVWVKRKNPHLFLAGLLMFAFAALAPATGNFDLMFFISMFGEVAMTLFFYLFAKKEQKN